jgi:hypothetical protein
LERLAKKFTYEVVIALIPEAQKKVAFLPYPPLSHSSPSCRPVYPSLAALSVAIFIMPLRCSLEQLQILSAIRKQKVKAQRKKDARKAAAENGDGEKKKVARNNHMQGTLISLSFCVCPPCVSVVLTDFPLFITLFPCTLG